MCVLRDVASSLKMILVLLETQVQKLRTKYGYFSADYVATTLQRCFGTGQGSGGSPLFWTAISEVIYNYVYEDLTGLNPKHGI